MEQFWASYNSSRFDSFILIQPNNKCLMCLHLPIFNDPFVATMIAVLTVCEIFSGYFHEKTWQLIMLVSQNNIEMSISQEFSLFLHACCRPVSSTKPPWLLATRRWDKARGGVGVTMLLPWANGDQPEQKREVAIVFVRGFIPLRDLSHGGSVMANTRMDPWSTYTSARVGSSVAAWKLELEHPLLLFKESVHLSCHY